MDPWLNAISHHGSLLIFGLVFAEAVGLPLPAALALVAAGAAAAAHIIAAPTAFLSAVLGLMLGDILLFLLGRYTGWALLSFICGISLNPETCILRSAESFYKRGRITLVFAKFVPGLSTMAAPLAGSMKMRVAQFLRLDLLGVLLYVVAYGALGYVFRDLMVELTRRVVGAGHVVAFIGLLVLVAYASYRLVEYRRYVLSGAVPRVAVEELVRRLSSGDDKDIIVADVRSHGYYDPGAARIARSIRIEPNRLLEELKTLPRNKDIYLYCT
jgi:membrane protein DedA with SNARE-associated domain